MTSATFLLSYETLAHQQHFIYGERTAADLLVAPGNRLLQLLDLHLTRHDLPFLWEDHR